MGYSYDITLNRLGVIGTSGSHEFSVKYFWDVARRRDPRPPYHPVWNIDQCPSPTWLTSGSKDTPNRSFTDAMTSWPSPHLFLSRPKVHQHQRLAVVRRGWFGCGLSTPPAR